MLLYQLLQPDNATQCQQMQTCRRNDVTWVEIFFLPSVARIKQTYLASPGAGVSFRFRLPLPEDKIVSVRNVARTVCERGKIDANKLSIQASFTILTYVV
jgi:hypothetical protein